MSDSLTASMGQDAFLIWEDEEPGSDAWWITRAREATSAGRRDFLIAEDDLTDALVCVVLHPRGRRYVVIAVAWFKDFPTRFDALAAAKAAAVDWLVAPHHPGTRQAVQRWLLSRASRVIWRNMPLAGAGFVLGAVLGTVVGLFAVTSGLVGWPTLLAGLIIGIGSGPALKFLVDRKPKATTLTGPWMRFGILTVTAIIGAALAAGAIVTMKWS